MDCNNRSSSPWRTYLSNNKRWFANNVFGPLCLLGFLKYRKGDYQYSYKKMIAPTRQYILWKTTKPLENYMLILCHVWTDSQFECDYLADPLQLIAKQLMLFLMKCFLFEADYRVTLCKIFCHINCVLFHVFTAASPVGCCAAVLWRNTHSMQKSNLHTYKTVSLKQVIQSQNYTRYSSTTLMCQWWTQLLSIQAT